jgi:hypothetical protein
MDVCFETRLVHVAFQNEPIYILCMVKQSSVPSHFNTFLLYRSTVGILKSGVSMSSYIDRTARLECNPLYIQAIQVRNTKFQRLQVPFSVFTVPNGG